MKHWYLNERKVPKSMPKKETEALVEELKELRRVATFESAGFFIFEDDAEERNNEIREITKLYRESWLIRPLDELIERYEAVIARD